VLALLGIARRYLDRGNAALHYLSEAAFPIYILHQAAIVVPGYFLIRLPVGIWVKVLLLLAVSVGLAFAVYHFIVRVWGPARFVFGMRARVCARPLSPARAAAALLLVASVRPAAPVEGASPEGRWYAEGGAAQVDVARCGQSLCAKVAWLRAPFDENGCELRDGLNADARLRERPLEGLELFHGLAQSPEDEDVWTGGSIYDPTSGRTYRCRVRVDGDRLHVRGYLGVPMLGRTTTWIRVGRQAGTCREATRESRP
jgi:uncharacterized protein (DUF2147 family)